MITCPSCGTEALEGADECPQCGNSLSQLHLQEPADSAERAVLEDRLAALNPSRPICVAPDVPVRDVIRLLVKHHIGSVVITEADKVVGIFSERDALMKINADVAQLGDRPVSEFMTPTPKTLVADARVAFALKEMDLGGYRHIPIVDEESRLTGVISIRDVLRYLTEKLTERDVDYGSQRG